MKYRIIRNIALLTLIILTSVPVFAQRRYTVSGFVRDISSGETLIGATVVDLHSGAGAVTNSYGFYSLTIPEGEARLSSSYVGYETVEMVIDLRQDVDINIGLPMNAELMGASVVASRRDLGVRGAQMSAIDVPLEQIKVVPVMFGENDVLKALQLLPGVQAGTEGSAGLYVRGGSPDENLLLIDGVPVYNVNHMFGLFSVFNPDAIKNVTLYKGSFPAHYAGRLSSIVDVRLKDGDMYNYHGNASIGFITSKFNLEGPIWKGRTSFNVSARRTYSDIYQNLALWYNTLFLLKDVKNLSAGYYFYDINAKINHIFSDRDRLYLSWYNGDDKVYFGTRIVESKEFDLDADYRWRWGNLVAAARWNHVVNKKLFMDVSASYTQYRHRMGLGVEEQLFSDDQSFSVDLDMHSGIFDKTLRTDFHYSPSAHHEIRYGAGYTHHKFRPDVFIATVDETNGEEHRTEEEKSIRSEVLAHETQVYLEDNWSPWDAFNVNVGLNWSMFNVNGRTYHSLEPRISGRVLLAEHFSIKAGYAYMSQYVHLLSNNSISLPTDLWVPVTDRILPETSHQWAVGAVYEIPGGADFSAEAYCKLQHNLLECIDGASFMSGDMDWQDKVAMGDGTNYGIELMAQRSVGRFTGWLSYTWSHAERLFNREGMVLNGGKPFNAKYDRRHEVNVTLNYKFGPRFDISGSWVFSTGNCGTVYTQFFEPDSSLEGVDVFYYGTSSLGYADGRNNYRLPPYHRADVGFNLHRKFNKRVSRTINVSVYNAYSRQNPFLLYVHTEYDGGGSSTRTLRQVSLFPIIPSISYQLSF